MAKTKSKTKTSKIVLVVAIVLIAAIATIFIFRAISHSSNENEESNEDYTSMEEGKASEDLDPAGVQDTAKDEAIDLPAQYEGEDANSAANLSGSLAYTNLSGSTLTVGVNIDQFLSSGTCSVSVGSASATADIEPSVSTSSCTATLNGLSSGTYSFTITLKSGDKTGTITGEIQI